MCLGLVSRPTCELKDLAGFLTPIWRPKVESLDNEKERARPTQYGITGCGVFKGGIQN